MKPGVAVDGVLIKNKKILLIKRGNEPFKNKWALPGGFVEYGERVEEAIVREFKEETGINVRIKKFFGVFSDPDRDPRGHVISIVFLLESDDEQRAGDDAIDARFFDLDNLPELAFDHKKIIEEVMKYGM
jgi:8-oxo-dGTP diphosphatase